jgi:F-type H+-transporting ATPase subunit b
MWRDPMFWYTIAFTLFMVLAWRYGHKPLLGWLDTEINRIRVQLEEARTLRAEAETLFAEYKTKHAVGIKEAEAILRRAQDEAAQLRAQAEKDLDAALAWHEQQAKDRIGIAETEARNAVRTAAVDAAMQKARDIIAARGAEGKLTDKAIAELPHLVRTEAKAA